MVAYHQSDRSRSRIPSFLLLEETVAVMSRTMEGNTKGFARTQSVLLNKQKVESEASKAGLRNFTFLTNGDRLCAFPHMVRSAKSGFNNQGL